MKSLPPILFALLMTGVIAVSMVLIGGNALFNKNSMPVANSPVVVSDMTNISSTTSNQQVSAMQQLINQYQEREKQYQAQVNEAVQRLNQANQQLQQANGQIQQANQAVATYQQVLQELQRRGLIRIDNSGQIFLGRGETD
jgi:multidrug resistance efflux pump